VRGAKIIVEPDETIICSDRFAKLRRSPEDGVCRVVVRRDQAPEVRSVRAGKDPAGGKGLLRHRISHRVGGYRIIGILRRLGGVDLQGIRGQAGMTDRLSSALDALYKPVLLKRREEQQAPAA